MGTLVQDLKYGLRMLAKNPGFTAVAVLALAVGIAANTAIFSVYNAAALRPFQAAEPDRLVNVFRTTFEDRYGWSFSYPDYVYLRDRNKEFSGLIAADDIQVAVSGGEGSGKSPTTAGGISELAGIRFFQQMAGGAELVPAAMVSGNYFSVLGIDAVKGRTFTKEEADGIYPAVMLSYNFWQRRFNCDPSLLGRTMKLNGKQFTIVGITPKDFMGTFPKVLSVWLPLSAFPLL